MDQSNQELLNRFNEVLKKLPVEERQKLYERLKALSPEQRTIAVKTIVDRYASYEATHAKPEVKVNKPSETPSKPATNMAEIKKEVNASDSSKSLKFAEDEEVEVKRKENKPKKKLKKGVKRAIAGFVAAVVLIAGILAVVLNLDALKAKFASSEPDTTVSSETVWEPEQTTTVIDETVATEETTTEVTEELPPPGPTNVPIQPGAPDLSGLVIVLDPGHQSVADEAAEECAPWLSISKPRCTVGAFGSVTETPEYDLTLQYCLIMQNYLEQCGATVLLTRDSNDVNMSNQERALFAVENNADVFIRIHCDSANDAIASGVRVYVPDTGDYTSSNIAWGDMLGGLIADAEGLTFDETRQTYLYTGLNYANTVPCFQLSLGFLSNAENEAVLLNPDNELAVAAAISEFCANFL